MNLNHENQQLVHYFQTQKLCFFIIALILIALSLIINQSFI